MFNFKHKNTEFFDLFVDSAKYFYKGALIMEEVMLDSTKAVAKMKEILNKVDDNALIIFENKKSREIVKDLFLEKQFY